MLVCLIKGHKNEMILVNITSANCVRKLGIIVSHTRRQQLQLSLLWEHTCSRYAQWSVNSSSSNQQLFTELAHKISLFSCTAKR